MPHYGGPLETIQQKPRWVQEYPTTRGAFRITRFLGSGGEGEVYEARRVENESASQAGDRFALKVFPGVRAPVQHSFRNHWALGRLCRHPNIVRTHGCGEIDGTPYIAMELVEGVDLGTILEQTRKTPPPSATIEIALCLCEALEYLHDLHDEQGAWLSVIYRDLKPENVLVDFRGAIKLVDFGVTQFLGRKGGVGFGRTEGTPTFVSPEQALGGTQDARSDVFTFGSLLYTLLVGVAPFVGKETSVRAVFNNTVGCEEPAARAERQQRVEEIAEPFWSVIDRCHKLSSFERPRSMAEVREMLLGIVRPYGRHAARLSLQRWAGQAIPPLMNNQNAA